MFGKKKLVELERNHKKALSELRMRHLDEMQEAQDKVHKLLSIVESTLYAGENWSRSLINFINNQDSKKKDSIFYQSSTRITVGEKTTISLQIDRESELVSIFWAGLGTQDIRFRGLFVGTKHIEYLDGEGLDLQALKDRPGFGEIVKPWETVRVELDRANNIHYEPIIVVYASFRPLPFKGGAI